MAKKRGHESLERTIRTQNPNYEPIVKRQRINDSLSTSENNAPRSSTTNSSKPNGFSLAQNKHAKLNGSSQTSHQAYIPSAHPPPLQLHTKTSSPSHVRTTTSLPTLPPILDPTLRLAPFIHQGTTGGIHFSIATSISYERLEFLGDAYLELLASRLLFTTYPLLTPGRLSQKRELVSLPWALSAPF